MHGQGRAEVHVEVRKAEEAFGQGCHKKMTFAAFLESVLAGDETLFLSTQPVRVMSAILLRMMVGSGSICLLLPSTSALHARLACALSVPAAIALNITRPTGQHHGTRRPPRATFSSSISFGQ